LSDRLARLFEEHARAAFQRSEAGFPDFAVDSWSDPAVPGQWVVLEDDEGRRSQARLSNQIVRGVPLREGSLAGSAEKLVRAVLAELREYVGPGGTVVSRPLPEPAAEGLHCAHLEFRGVWWRLTAGHDGERPVAVLAALLGKGATPLDEPEERVVWL
jgi:hypothetical protein